MHGKDDMITDFNSLFCPGNSDWNFFSSVFNIERKESNFTGI